MGDAVISKNGENGSRLSTPGVGKKVKQTAAPVKTRRGPGRPPGSKNKKTQKAKGARGRKAAAAQIATLPDPTTLPIEYLLQCARRLKQIQKDVSAVL